MSDVRRRRALLLLPSMMAAVATVDAAAFFRPRSQRASAAARPLSDLRGGSSEGPVSEDAAWKVRVDPLARELPSDMAQEAAPAFRGSADGAAGFDYPKPLVGEPAAAAAKEVPTAPPAPATAPPARPGKLADLLTRTAPAALMLAAVGAVAAYGKEDGLIGLAVLLQAGMYREAVRTIGGGSAADWNVWWWFLTGLVAADGERLIPWASAKLGSVAYGMIATGIVLQICKFNLQKSTCTPQDFREYLRTAAVAHLSLLLTVVPSSYWIATLEDFGRSWILHSSLLVIINDTMAYVFGMLFGRHRLVPTISSKKTWEGFLGALLSTCLFARYYFGAVAQKCYVEAAAPHLVAVGMRMAVFVSTVAPFGGFLASVVKRAYGHKDFGNVFPGHGGWIDRFDCHVFAAPFVYLYLSAITAKGAPGSILTMK